MRKCRVLVNASYITGFECNVVEFWRIEPSQIVRASNSNPKFSQVVNLWGSGKNLLFECVTRIFKHFKVNPIPLLI
jgi:hypothetical protein